MSGGGRAREALLAPPAAAAAAAAAAAVALAAAGFAAGWYVRSRASSSGSSAGGVGLGGAGADRGTEGGNDGADPRLHASNARRLCECGFDLTGKGDLQVRRHLEGRQHRVNLHRTGGSPVLVTAKINEYRDAITTHVVPSDVTLEIGCAEGLTTQRLAQRSRVAIGIDQHGFLIDRARARVGQPPEGDDGKGAAANGGARAVVQAPPGRGWSNLHFHAADAFDKKALIAIVDRALGISPEEESAAFRREVKARRREAEASSEAAPHGVGEEGAEPSTSRMSRREERKWRLRSGKGGEGPKMHLGKVTKIFLDVSGSRETRVVVHLIDILVAMFQPDLIVVKSDRLKNLVRRSYLPSSVIPGLTRPPVYTPYVIN